MRRTVASRNPAVGPAMNLKTSSKRKPTGHRSSRSPTGSPQGSRPRETSAAKAGGIHSVSQVSGISRPNAWRDDDSQRVPSRSWAKASEAHGRQPGRTTRERVPARPTRRRLLVAPRGNAASTSPARTGAERPHTFVIVTANGRLLGSNHVTRVTDSEMLSGALGCSNSGTTSWRPAGAGGTEASRGVRLSPTRLCASADRRPRAAPRP